MKQKTTLTFLTTIFFLISLACAGSSSAPAAPEQSPPSDTDIQATVDASIAATNTAEAEMQATIDASVEATVQAQPTPKPADVSELSEDEVVSEIETAVDETAAATESAAATSTTATSDGTVTAEEVDEIYTYYDDAYEDLLYAYSLIYAYYDVYGELAEETLELLIALEEDLGELDDSLNAIADALNEIDSTLEAGLELAEETITQLETAAQEASAKATEAQSQAQTWAADHKSELETRGTSILETLPDNVPADRAAVIESAFVYLDTVKNALADSKITMPELDAIALAGANASAGLRTNGGPQLQSLAGNVDQLTTQLAQGQLPAAQTGVGNFEASLPERPSRP